MCEEPLWDKCKMTQEAQKLGLPISRLYQLGFPHNNCGGCCVRAGISHWVHVYHHLPEKFAEWEREEELTIELFRQIGVSSAGWTILKDRRGGVARPMTLKQLRQRIEAKEKLPKMEWGGCGCGGVFDASETDLKEALQPV